jgi:hypothetical protein
MNKVEINIKYKEEDMIHFIKDLLSMNAGTVWTRKTVHNELSFLSTGNRENIQKAIYEWLSTPERKHNFELMGGKK